MFVFYLFVVAKGRLFICRFFVVPCHVVPVITLLLGLAYRSVLTFRFAFTYDMHTKNNIGLELTG